MAEPFAAKKPSHKQEVELDRDFIELNDRAAQDTARQFPQAANQAIGTQIQPLQSKELVKAALEGREDDFKSLLTDLSAEQQTAVHTICMSEFLKQQGRLVNRASVEAIAKGDIEGTTYWLGKSATNAHKRKRLGESGAQVKNLLEIGESLNDTQKRDMLKAALEMGFSAASVFSMESEWKLAQEIKEEAFGEGATTSAELNMQMVATRLMREKLDDLRKALENVKTKGESEERRKKANEAEERLAHLVGNRRAEDARKMLSRHGTEVEDTIANNLAHALEMSKELHRGGRLGKIAVLPRTEGPR